MNPVQLVIIAIVVFLIIVLLGYFWYQEIKFKKLVESNFNHKTEDVIEESQPLVLDGVNSLELALKPNKLEKDIFKPVHSKEPNLDSLFKSTKSEPAEDTKVEEDYPADSLEAIFAGINKLPFPYKDEVNVTLDYIIDIAFEEPIKIKLLPDIAQYTHKHYTVYLLDKHDNWQIFEKGNKYFVKAIKYVVELVDKTGIVSQAQVSNIYNELFKFVLQNMGHIQHSDYDASIYKIQQQVKYLPEMKLDLELYLILQTGADFNTLANFFMSNNFTNISGKFNYINNGVTEFIISDESGNPLERGINYKYLRITSNLHFVPKPLQVIEDIFDLADRFMAQFESRILTTNKQLFSEREYMSLTRYISNYENNAKKFGVELGGELIRRLF